MRKANFDGKVAIVTGGGSGMGQATALAFATEGCYVAVVDIDGEAVEATLKKLKTLNGQGMAVTADVADNRQVAVAIRRVLDEQGKIDILVNNAGLALMERFVEGEGAEEAWNRVIDVNLKGTMFFCHAVLRDMIKRNYGKVINISSDAARTGGSGMVVYSAAKAGVVGFTKALALEMARYKINVNCICPGFTETPMLDKSSEEAPTRLIEAHTRQIPWKALGKPDDIAAAVLFLASDDARYITGQTLSVNGGLTRV